MRVVSFVLFAPTLLVAVAARAQDTCAIEGFAPGPHLVQDELLAQWTDEAAALAPFGADATFDLDAVEVHVTLESAGVLAEARALLALSAPSPSIADVVIDGIGAGRLELVGGPLTFTNATLTSANVTQVTTGADVVTLAIVVDETLGLDLTGAVLTGYDSAVLVDATGTSTTLGASVTLASAGVLTCTGNVGEARVDAATLEVGGFALAGDFTAGTTTVDAAPILGARTIIGREGVLAVDATGISGTGRVTQVFDDTAPVMPAEIELVVLTPLVVVPQGSSVNVPAIVRNKSAKAIAIADAIEVDGCATAAVTPVVDDTLPSFVGALVGVIESSGWAAPFVALALAPVLGVAVVVDAFVSIADAFTDVVGDIFCGLFGCDDGEEPAPPVPPIPYPRWLEPGAVALFEIALLPNLDADDYPVRVRFAGKNHPEAHVDFTLRVGRGDAPGAWVCPLDQFGAGDGCHCGCGARDRDCPADATVDACDVIACSEGFTHLEEDIAVCIADPAPPPPPADDDDDDDEERFDCGATPSSSWAALALLLALLRRRATAGC